MNSDGVSSRPSENEESVERPKAKRIWPGRKKHKPPNPPRMLRLTEELKSHIQHDLNAA